jgi:hypothetical protein
MVPDQFERWLEDELKAEVPPRGAVAFAAAG